MGTGLLTDAMKLPVIVAVGLAVIVGAAFYAAYRLIDPLPPRRFAIAAGFAGTPYDNFARQYAAILARHGVEVEIRNTVSTVNNLDLLRSASSGVQAALMTFGFTQSNDADTLYSLGGIFDAPIFIFYKSAEPITQFAQFRGKRLSSWAARDVATIQRDGNSESSRRNGCPLRRSGYTQSVDALLADEIEIAIFPSQLDGSQLQRALAAPGVRLMSVAHAESIAKLIPGLKRVVLWRGLISLSHDIPDSDIDLLAFRSRVLVRNDLHPALQFLLLEAMREVHTPPGPFNRFGEFPADNLTTCPSLPQQKRSTAQARRSGNATHRFGLVLWLIEFCSLWSQSSWHWSLSSGSPFPLSGDCMFAVSIDYIGLWASWNAIMPKGAAGMTHRGINNDCKKSVQPCGRSRWQPHSKPIYIVSGFICGWFRKILAAQQHFMASTVTERAAALSNRMSEAATTKALPSEPLPRLGTYVLGGHNNSSAAAKAAGTTDW